MTRKEVIGDATLNMQVTDAQILACNGDPDEPTISSPDADLLAFGRAVLSLISDPHKVEREAHFALQDRMFFKSTNPRVRRLQDAVEGELDGLGISNAKAEAILRYMDEMAPADDLPFSWPLTDREIEQIAGRDELTGDAILRFARDLLAVASWAKP